MKFYYNAQVLCLISILICASLASLQVTAQSIDTATTQTLPSSPYNVLRNTADNLFSRISSSQEELKSNPEFMNTIVEEELMPSVDHTYAAYKILGKHLRKTTKLQRAQFVSTMRTDLVKTYASVLKQYTTQQVVYEDERSTEGKKIVAVKTQIVDQNSPDIDVVFKMRLNKKSGQWKAYDIVVEGISLISSKQAEMGKMISTQGLDKVMFNACMEITGCNVDEKPLVTNL
jgi:phospholipid transport system substrate-binding protein